MSEKIEASSERQTQHTSRGFAFVEFTDAYGVECKIQKSSLATDDAIWFGAQEIGLKHFKAFEGWMDVPTPHSIEEHWSANTSMHLTRWQVAALLPVLQHFAATGEVDGSPATTPADAFSSWLSQGPMLAKAAGCHVGIKVTEAKTGGPS